MWVTTRMILTAALRDLAELGAIMLAIFIPLTFYVCVVGACATTADERPLYHVCEAMCRRAFTRCQHLEEAYARQLACGDQYVDCLKVECKLPEGEER